MCRHVSAFAVMGNHELNAIGWALRNERSIPLRKHSINNGRQNEKFLASINPGSLLHEEIIDWFLTLPLSIDLPELGIFRACWHEVSQQGIRPYLDKRLRLDKSEIAEIYDQETIAYDAIEVQLKGPEIELPPGYFFFDSENIERQSVRIQWWRTEPISLQGLIKNMQSKELQYANNLFLMAINIYPKSNFFRALLASWSIFSP
jgi:hypothetical protein